MISKQSIALVSIIFLFIISFSISNADAAIYMKIEGIKGEATTLLPQCSNECIELHSFQFGVGGAVSDSGSGGGRETSNPSFSDFVFAKTLDGTTPKIFTEIVTGTPKKVEIFLVRDDGKLFAKYTLNDSLFSGYSASSGGDRPTESLSLNFVKLDVVYNQFDSKGILVDTVTACWDIVKNSACSSSGGGGDPDSDGDGTPDSSDACPADFEKTEPGQCGCGIADSDSDGDGIADCNDTCPLDSDNDTDSDGICGDVDNCPADSNADQTDGDADGAGDACDLPTITVTKIINGGPLTVSDFDLFVGDAQVSSGIALSVLPGEYTIKESELDDYTSSYSGDCVEVDLNDSRRGMIHDARVKIIALQNAIEDDPDSPSNPDREAQIQDLNAKIAALRDAISATIVISDGQNLTCDVTNTFQDSDSDGVADLADNCPETPNIDQLDTDSDRAGNACDSDDDNDGLYDDVDVEPLVSSSAFSNSLLGGNEFGSVNSGFVIVTDVGSGEQLSLSAVFDSQVSACDLAILTLVSGSEILVDCGSITVSVASGSITAQYAVGDETATVTLDEGESLTFDSDTASFTAGDDTEVTITIGNQTITIGANQTVTVQNVSIDIKPGDVQNVVNLQAKGVLPVAILSSVEFDATSIDPLSVKFGPNGATESHRRGHIEDVNRDGLADLMLHFNIQDIGIDENTTELELSGRTTDGNLIKGSGDVVVKGKKIKEN